MDFSFKDCHFQSISGCIRQIQFRFERPVEGKALWQGSDFSSLPAGFWCLGMPWNALECLVQGKIRKQTCLRYIQAPSVGLLACDRHQLLYIRTYAVVFTPLTSAQKTQLYISVFSSFISIGYAFSTIDLFQGGKMLVKVPGYCKSHLEAKIFT